VIYVLADLIHRAYYLLVPALLRHRAFETALRSVPCSRSGKRAMTSSVGTELSPLSGGFVISGALNVLGDMPHI